MGPIARHQGKAFFAIQPVRMGDRANAEVSRLSLSFLFSFSLSSVLPDACLCRGHIEKCMWWLSKISTSMPLKSDQCQALRGKIGQKKQTQTMKNQRHTDKAILINKVTEYHPILQINMMWKK